MTVTASVGSTQTVTLSFVSSGAAATNLTVDPASLPAGWTVSGANTCASVTSTGGCSVTLTFAPTASTNSGTLALAFGYTDDLGTAQTGSLNVAYIVKPLVGYITSGSDANAAAASTVLACGVDANSNFTACHATAAGSPAGIPTSINFVGQTAYITNFGNPGVAAAATPVVSKCTPDATTGDLTCVDSGVSYVVNGGAGVPRPFNIAFNTDVSVNGGTDAYVLDQNAGIFKCTAAADGSLSACISANNGFLFGNPTAMAIVGKNAYITNNGGPIVQKCTINASGLLTACADSGATGLSGSRDIVVQGSNAYVVDQNAQTIFRFAIDPVSGTLTGGIDSGARADASNTLLARPNAIRFKGTKAFITNRSSGAVTQCSVDSATGLLSACATTGATGTVNAFGIALN